MSRSVIRDRPWFRVCRSVRADGLATGLHPGVGRTPFGQKECRLLDKPGRCAIVVLSHPAFGADLFLTPTSAKLAEQIEGFLVTEFEDLPN